MWYLESLKGQLCALCWGHCWLPASPWVLWWDRTLQGSLCRIHCCCDGLEGCLQLPLVQNFFLVALLVPVEALEIAWRMAAMHRWSLQCDGRGAMALRSLSRAGVGSASCTGKSVLGSSGCC